MARNKRVYPPSWLPSQAKDYYRTIRKEYGDINAEQEELLAMVANEYTTYLTANIVLQDVVESGGNICESDYYKLQKEALSNYIRLRRQLRLSLESKAVPAAPVGGKLDI